ncbi:MAG: hypothetical protein ACKN89_02635 [Cyanobium sp.]
MRKSKQRLRNALWFATGSFAITTTLGQILSIQTPVSDFFSLNNWQTKIIILLPNLISWITVLYFWSTRKRIRIGKDSLDIIGDVMRVETTTRFRFVRDEQDYRDVWEWDEKVFGKFNLDFNDLLSWWQTYSHGTFIAEKLDRKLGYIGLWPLKSESFRKLREYRLKDSQLRDHDFHNDSDVSQCRTWYLSAVVIEDDRDLLPARIISERFLLLSQDLSAFESFSLIFIPMTKEEFSIAEILGMKPLPKPSDKGFTRVFMLADVPVNDFSLRVERLKIKCDERLKVS